MKIYLQIEGRVQRVGYRRWIKNKISEIGGISGFIKNEEDGSVVLFMDGDEKQINDMIRYCSEGPMLARVDSVKIISQYENLYKVKSGQFYCF